MTSLDLTKSIYDKAQQNGKQAWLSNSQNSFLFSLLNKENRFDCKMKRHFIAYILPNGEWVINLTFEESLKIGKENIKTAYVVSPPFYIKREGFNAQKIVIE